MNKKYINRNKNLGHKKNHRNVRKTRNEFWRKKFSEFDGCMTPTHMKWSPLSWFVQGIIRICRSSYLIFFLLNNFITFFNVTCIQALVQLW